MQFLLGRMCILCNYLFMTLFELKKQIHRKAKKIGRKKAIEQIMEITKYGDSISEKLASGSYPNGMHPLAIEELTNWVQQEDEEDPPPKNAA